MMHFLKYGFEKDESETKAEKYNFWETCGFEYSDLQQDFLPTKTELTVKVMPPVVQWNLWQFPFGTENETRMDTIFNQHQFLPTKTQLTVKVMPSLIQ